MRPFRLEAPVGELIPVAELRDNTRLETATEDVSLTNDLQAAIDYLDGYSGRLGRCILKQKWALPIDLLTEAVFLPFPDCREFKVESKDQDDVWQEAAGVSFSQHDDLLEIFDLPENTTGLRLTFHAGWEDVQSVPANLKKAIKFLVTQWYDNRSAVGFGASVHEIPLGFEAMIRPLVYVMV